MDVTLLGTGDTTGTPTPDCDCDTCRRARERGVERSRFSVHVHNERTGESLLVDASPDLRSQLLTHEVPLPDAILISHIHFDHLDGLGNAYRLLEDVPVFAADETDPETGQSVAETVAEKYHYLDAITVEPRSPFEPFEACGLEVTLVPVEHPPLVCYGLAIEDPETGTKLSLSGDSNYGIGADSRDRLRDPDLLFVDGIVPSIHAEHHPIGGDHPDAEGTYRTFGTKHMTIEGARVLADDLAADDYRIVHLSHYIPAGEAFADDMAVDGERFSL
ncbi:MBL fold metallo-hydrolase [Natronomonas sp. F2-12]|jgi:phosphoribosyl 1,2-cyclic phosphate phosphodiesterase|uniref:MBL fold metallo-hydrolase n=1 Tax=Natronomonas aquatica TaxID=2841590 RepID=A0A9R1CUH6_9EURY|nr:MBL fold metallo-hydrolase [Natronomonas aquatica]MCQ4334023.1 MBL fold metallo-hydrolase [Natronomonas aquatica]